MHGEDIFHGAIEPETILIAEDGHLVLAGFEQSSLVKSSQTDHGSGCLESGQVQIAIRAPELILGWGCDCKTDMWGVGLVLSFLLSGMVRHLVSPSYHSPHHIGKLAPIHR